MPSEYQEFPSRFPELHSKIHIVLTEPEEPRNIGAVARVMKNMGIEGSLNIVGSPEIITVDSYRVAKHAKEILDTAVFFNDLKSCLESGVWKDSRSIVLAASARIGSSHRPHPVKVRQAIQNATQKLVEKMADHLIFVFGRESKGLTNDEVALCDEIVTIPSSPTYRSLNLSQSVMVFCYETRENFVADWLPMQSDRPSQKMRLIEHFIRVNEASGFILPGDPHKMKAHLESMLAGVPAHIPEASTWHGLMDQIVRSIQKGEPDIRAKYAKRKLIP